MCVQLHLLRALDPNEDGHWSMFPSYLAMPNLFVRLLQVHGLRALQLQCVLLWIKRLHEELVLREEVRRGMQPPREVA